MKTFLLVLFLGVFLVATDVHAGKPTCENLTGEWINELGSTLTISKIGKDGKIDGTYASPSGTGGKPVALIGWSNSLSPKAGKDNVRVVSFSVHWGDYGSVTSWSGACSIKEGKPTISTIWNLVRSNSDFAWDHILTNSDNFNPK